jgi:K+-transporting ATPase c subunit
MDPFLSALEELAQALSAGEDPDQAIAEVADDHGLAAHALRNRAASKKERERNAVQANPALAAATFLAQVSNLNPKLTQQEWEAQTRRLAAEFGVDLAAHRSAVNRVRRRY